MLDRKYEAIVKRIDGWGDERIIYFKPNIFVSKEDIEEITERPVDVIRHEKLMDAIHRMLHDGNSKTLVIGETISADTFSKLSDFSISQFIFKNLPGFWIEIKR